MNTKLPLFSLAATLTTGCIDQLLKGSEDIEEEEAEDEDEERTEGALQGDCFDGEDNDEDGDVDCEDSGCFDKPVCQDTTDTGGDSANESVNGSWSLSSSEADCDTSSEASSEYCIQFSRFDMLVENDEITSSDVILSLFDGGLEGYEETYSMSASDLSGSGNQYSLIVYGYELSCALSNDELDCSGDISSYLAQATLQR